MNWHGSLSMIKSLRPQFRSEGSSDQARIFHKVADQPTLTCKSPLVSLFTFGEVFQSTIKALLLYTARKGKCLLSLSRAWINSAHFNSTDSWLAGENQCSSLLSSPSWLWLICLTFCGSRALCPNIRKKIMMPKINHWNTEFGSTVLYSSGDGVGC